MTPSKSSPLNRVGSPLPSPGAPNEGKGIRARISGAAGAVLRVSRSTAGRMSWGVADQAASSITNFAVGAVVARTLGVIDFGIFALVWATYGVILNISRGLTTDPLMVRFSGVSTASWRAAVSPACGTALLVGIGTGAASIVVGSIVGGPIGIAFIALGLTLPGLLLQDSWRFAFFAAGQGSKALVNDVVWAVALIPTMYIAVQTRSIFGFVLAWGLGAAVSAVVASFQARLLPSVTGGRRWYRQQRDLGLRFLVENVSISGSGQLWMCGLGAIAGLTAVGALRGGQLALGPLIAAFMGLGLVAVPEASRALHRSTHQLTLFCLSLGAVQAFATLAWGLGLIFLLPDHVGTYVLGSVWEPASALILPLTIAQVVSSISNAACTGLRALGAAHRSVRAQLTYSGVCVTGGLIGAAIGGVLSSCWGVTLGTLLIGPRWWVEFRAALREHELTPRNQCRTAGAQHSNEP